MPWLPSSSNIAGFYERVGLADSLVASSTSHYFSIASSLAIDRELAYRLRVAILDAIDAECASSTSKAGGRRRVLGLFKRSSTPWAMIREEFFEETHKGRAVSSKSTVSSAYSLHRRRGKAASSSRERSHDTSKKDKGRRKRRKRASRTAAAYDLGYDIGGGEIIIE